MLIMELTPGDITPEKLSQGQKIREKLPSAVYHVVRHLCGLKTHECDISADAEAIRNQHLAVGHTRTPSIIGRLCATGHWMIEFARKQGVISGKLAQEYTAEMLRSIITTGERQKVYLETADPIEIFKAGLRQAVGSLANHLRRFNGGVPPKPIQMGWSADNPDDDLPNYRAHGPCIGWTRVDKDELYLEVNLGYNAVKKACGNDLTLTKQTLMKRLKDGGLLTRIDEGRQRNTLRLVCDGHLRQVMCLQLSQVFDMDDNETPDHGDSYEGEE